MNSWIDIVEQEIEPDKASLFLRHPDFGAELIFYGVVRNSNADRMVEAITYEAHIEMARKVLHEIVCEAGALMKCDARIVLLHRVGRLAVGEVSTAIGVSCGHRDAAYIGSRFLIEELKRRVPIWKEEHYHDGRSRWLDGTQLS